MSTSGDVLARLEHVGIVPVVVVDDPDHGAPLAEALRDAGIGCAEFTLRTPAGLGALAGAARVDGFLAGAGTVLSPVQADAVADAGAAFVVSPGYAPEVIDRARAREVAMVPGVATPTEVQRAMADGFSHVKVFPAGLLGGTAYLDALGGPFPDLRVLPSGGVSADNLVDYLSRPQVFAASGSWMVPRAAIATGDFESVGRLAEACAALRDRARSAR
ncbi:bifunctional 4-hydroxy-2-oxoglutarate aldolase/2-dehydro-3-deoxy-phosphogluconate aldolase [Microbacterium sp. SORGH_AS_0888]|uniref:bifunctional 4-hydroxy-2-oxoglutarate aldolase/2-dehydro-3-deoxy-phosphogluconate aldolase n=1 Tax=Microbacterium sp. SORGH_AS_0888 TaxID=3041791 RepID=UPI00277FEB7E|nr:bifunctional 4-hydroxy-2-oxoglutarate aldolase/2-dehydro-3-deoxy-phosphogluconate aldolase [Microbacterium sp. SORGH_AS_0888]MDQ1130298.1 2-dehydro-3-deoxyphosphogluconate aldolase/(4S)-4-hydroxy-2-oxoglutarate aldolase [Microbacterium sp. SORGH_AS_0888]